MHQQGVFKNRGWISNSKKVMKVMNSEMNHGDKVVNLNVSDAIYALGLH